MKPFFLAIGLTVTSLCACRSAPAQSPASYLAPLPDAHAWPIEAKTWGTLPAPVPLPYGYWWSEYRGADIEHPLYAPRHHSNLHRTAPSCGCMSQFCCWFGNLFNSGCAGPQPLPCEYGESAAELPPPMPTFAPVPLSSQPREPLALEPAPMPRVELTPVPSVAPDFIPTPPALAPAPIVAAPQVVPEITTSPSPPQRAPIVESATPPVLAVPQELSPVRSPVVELAPEFVAPSEPTTPAPPRNRIPKPASPPRNTIPSQR